MRLRSVLLISVILVLIPLAAAAGQARITVGGAGGWTITADQIVRNSRSGIIELKKHVLLKHEGERMEADYVRFHEASRLVEVRGEVVFESADFRITCQRLILDLKNNVGKIYLGTIFFPSNNYYISGDEIEKTGPDTFRVSQGRVTTCEGPSPAWTFSARNIKVKREGYASATNATLSTRYFPVFYTPLIIFPVKNKRQSGFLIPEIKTSDRDGTGINLPYFWAISDSKDMTLSLTSLSKRGQNYGLEFRYRDWGGMGVYNIDYLNDQRAQTVTLPDGGIETYKRRYWLRGKSNLTTDSGFEIKFDLDYVSDPKLLPEFERTSFGFNKTNKQFIDEFGRGLAEPRDPYRKSSFLISKQVDPMQLNMALELTDNVSSSDNRDTLQRLPRINLDMPRTAVAGTPFFFSMDSSYTYFERKTGGRGSRWDIYPRLYWPTNLFGCLDTDPSIGFRETVYFADDLGNSAPDRKLESRELMDIELEMSTSFSRVFNLDRGRLEKIKHRVKPELTYRLVSGTNYDELPYFDFLDRIPREEIIEYGLVSYLVVKNRPEAKGSPAKGVSGLPPSYNELLRFKLSRTYNLLEARHDPAGASHGPWKAEYSLNFLPYFQIEGQSEYDTNSQNFTQHTIELNLEDKRADKVSIQYNFDKNNYEEIYYHLYLTLSQRISLEFENRRSLSENLDIETVYRLAYNAQCWGVQLEYVNRPDDQSMLALFSLAGLSKIGTGLIKPPWHW